jgi:hypothetical protein
MPKVGLLKDEFCDAAPLSEKPKTPERKKETGKDTPLGRLPTKPALIRIGKETTRRRTRPGWGHLIHTRDAV